MNENQLKLIFLDLKTLFDRQEILAQNLEDFIKSLKSREVKNYIESLSKGSKPESALREIFFSINSAFSKFLFRNVFPEVTEQEGFIDYLIKAEREEIGLEIKPLFDRIIKKERQGNVLLKIKKLTLNPEEYTKQILKYLKGTRDYIILTNLEEWYFYSKGASLDQECKPFGKAHLFNLLGDFKQVEDIWQYLDNQENLAIKEPLNKNFFLTMKSWVSELHQIHFITEESIKTELIINLINKFIFIQSLDSFWIISKNYIIEEWNAIERKWLAKNKKRILKKFLEDINEYFYELYDTELFKITEERKTIIEYLDQNDSNINLFYEKLKLILGLGYGQSPYNWMRGITQFNFRHIDEDILGKSYETYLAEIRKEKGIYYTPKSITMFIAENTIREQFSQIINQIEETLYQKEYEKSECLLEDLFSIKVLDPACGSGSFLIKALRVIWKEYGRLNELIERIYNKYSKFNENFYTTKEIDQDFSKISEIKKKLAYRDKRDFISKMILRHIYGVDLDKKAIEVVKLNLWLEAIKLAPNEFQYNKVPADTNHILPDLEINLHVGDSIVGLDDKEVMELLIKNHKSSLEKLFSLRNEYIENPKKINLIKKINSIKCEIKAQLNTKFKQFLIDHNIELDLLSKTLPFYWPLDFWFVYFNDSIKKRTEDRIGFDIIIGNPPYYTIRGKGAGALTQAYCYTYLQKSSHWQDYFRSQSDIYYYFIMKSIYLLKTSGKLGFIIESYWLENDYADNLKNEILQKTNILTLINFGRVKKIFEDADNDTCILLYTKIKKNHHKFKYVYCKKNFKAETHQKTIQKLMGYILEHYREDAFSDEFLDVFWINQDSLGKTKWILSKMDVMNLLEKIELNKTPLGDLCEIGQGVVPGRKLEFRISKEPEDKDAGGYWVNKTSSSIEVINNKDKNHYTLDTQFVKPLITNSGIKKYHLINNKEYLIYTVPFQDGRFKIENYKGIYDYLKVYEQELKSRYDYDGKKYPWYGYQRIQNIEIFERTDKKVLSPYRALENSFAIDSIGYFGTTDMYAMIKKTTNMIDLNYLLGLLNSIVLTFWYNRAGKAKGLIYEYFANPLKKMPIHIGTKKEQEIIKKYVQKISELKKVFSKYRKLWTECAKMYRNGIYSLDKLIFYDIENVQNGNFNDVWITEISILPNSADSMINEEYKQFKLRKLHDNTLVMIGIKDEVEKTLLSLKTKMTEFREIIYLEILDLLASRKKISNLSDIFTKTEISVIKPNVWEKSFNLIRLTKDKLKIWLEKKKVDLNIDQIINIEDDIEKLENIIDAYIFKLFELARMDVLYILEYLKIPKSKKDKIINLYDELIKT